MSRVLKNLNNCITQNYIENVHYGVDLVGEGHRIDEIVAHDDGIIIICQTGMVNNKGSRGNASYGNCLKIKHDKGYYTLYAHLDKVYVGLNERVKKGQVIGLMGNTGNSYGAHLHFEVYDKNNKRLNPEPFIDSDYSEKSYQTGLYKVTAVPWLNVRVNPCTNCAYKRHNELTENARYQNRNRGNENCDGLLPGVYVTVSEIRNGNWGKIPSGWICLDYCERA